MCCEPQRRICAVVTPRLSDLRIAGIDEAGRGPVIGPLVVAGVLVREGKLEFLRQLGVRDSKQLRPEEREVLYDRIIDVCEAVAVRVVYPTEIDLYVERQKRLTKLNLLEAKIFASIINELSPDRAYVDAADVNPERFAETIRSFLSQDVAIVSEHEADARYPIVAAASIVAKTVRERHVLLLQERYGDFGSGYCTDPKTLKFLKLWWKRYRHLPRFTRWSYLPAKRLVEEHAQMRLTRFFS